MKSIVNASYRALRLFELKELRLKKKLCDNIETIDHKQTHLFLQNLHGISIAKILQKIDNAILNNVMIDLLNYKTIQLEPDFVRELKRVLEYEGPKSKPRKKKKEKHEE